MLYTKTVDDHQIFSECRVILTDDNVWISNPTEEQIAAAGWVLYTPPPYVPQVRTEPDTYEAIAAVKRMLATSVESLTDEEALEVAALYPTWISKVGSEVHIGERYWYNEKLYKVLQNHTVQSDWTPDVSTSLFTEVTIDEWPEWRQPTGAQDAYRLGDKVSHNDKHWVSNIDYNTYEPGVYGWTEV